MKLQYLRAFIVLLAGLITLIVNMKTGKPVTLSLFIVLVVLLIFYFIGTLVVEILQKSLENQNQNDSTGDTEMSDEDVSEEAQQEEAIAFAFDEDDMDE